MNLDNAILIIFITRIVVMSALQLYFDNTKITKQFTEPHSDLQLSVVNQFSDCFVYVINFPSFDINSHAVTNPFVLLRYYSFSGTYELYPSEHECSNLTVEVQETKKNRQILKEKNALICQRRNTSIIYLNSIFREELKRAYKNSRCEAQVYLDPPTEDTLPSLYHEDEYLGKVIKDTFWVNYEIQYLKPDWKFNYINTTPKISIFIYEQNHQIPDIDEFMKILVSTALAYQEDKFLSHTILIWNSISSEYGQLQTYCAYCDPCNPFQMISRYTTKANFEQTLLQNVQQVNMFLPNYIDVILYFQTSYYDKLINEGSRTRKKLLKQISFMNYPSWFLRNVVDVHLFSILLPQNVTLKFKSEPDKDMGKLRYSKKSACPKKISVPGVLRLVLDRFVSLHLASRQDIALIFQRPQQRFVSCHKKEKPWKYQIKELIFAFDHSTWLLLGTSCVVVSFLCSISVNTKKSNSNILFTLYCLSASLLDQSSRLFQKYELRKILFCLPLIFLILGND